MERDFQQYPDNDNGNVLWALRCDGDKHEVARDIDFCLDFDSEEAALDCGAYLFKNLYRIELEEPLEDDPDSSWTVLAIPHMPANYEDICGVEAHLSAVAAQFGGKLSGWGCHTQADA